MTGVSSSRQDKRDWLFRQIRDVEGVVQATADASESERTLDPAAVDALDACGLMKLKLPEALGGVEADPVLQFEAIEEMTRLDTSAGWCFMVGATSVGLPGAFLADSAIKRIFVNGSVPRFAGVAMPGGQATRVNGGFQLSGRWPFASGVRHSSWLWCGAVVPGTDPPEIRILSFPKDDAEVIDDWHVSGLKGTGSCDVEVRNLQVPQEFTWALFADPPQRGGPLYRLGLPAFVTIEHSAFAAGAARRILDETVALSKNKKRGMPPTPVVDRGTFQAALGKSELRLAAARHLVLRTHEEAFERVSRGETLGPRDQAALRGCACYITEVAQSIAARMFRLAGAGARHNSEITAASATPSPCRRSIQR